MPNVTASSLSLSSPAEPLPVTVGADVKDAATSTKRRRRAPAGRSFLVGGVEELISLSAPLEKSTNFSPLASDAGYCILH